MKIQRALFPCFAAFLLCTVARAQDATFERTLTTSDHPDLYVSTGEGNIMVGSGDSGAIRLVGHVHANRNAGSDAGARVQQIAANPPVQQNGNTVRIGDAPDRRLYNNISVSYEIHAPRSAALNLRSGSGNITTQGIGRYLAADSGSGNVSAKAVAGPADLRSGSGNLELEQSGPGAVKVQSGSGDLRLLNINGTVEARTGSGDISAEGRLIGPSELRTGSGTVRVRLASGSKFHLSATSGSGSVHSDLPGVQPQGEEKNRLSGDVGGGGQQLEIETGSGNIDLHQP